MSLRARLLALLGLTWLLLGGTMMIWMYHRAADQLDEALDSRLAASANMVARLITQWPQPQADAPLKDPASIDVLARDGVACEVSEWRAEVLTRTLARTPGSPKLQAAADGLAYLDQKGVRWRTYVLEQGDLRIATADRLDLRDSLKREVALTALLPFGVCLLAGLGLLWLGIGQGLAPLERVRRLLTADVPLQRLDVSQARVPRELQPFTQTIDGLLQRMRLALQRERRFADNAAHEIRTPLTVVKTHLQILERLAPAEVNAAWRQSLGSAVQGADRLRHLIDQLLALTRAEYSSAGEDAGLQGDPAAAAGPAQTPGCELPYALGLALEGLERSRLELRLPPAGLRVALPAPLLASAVRNLLDNALKYSSGSVTLTARAQDGEIEIQVCDQGAGLDENALRLAVEPFWRGGQQVEGSGLGLAIVAAIARRFGGRLRLENAPGGGLRCRLIVPRGP
ncbi:hypothetical protein BBB39_15170 [Bordetella trematum]|uniref:histidine kinase n=2 Tax=Bordetella trematum TaxID=123899 RepID=A0A157S6U0_9BORD|nr:HAMP domain-containing sensor histidine kinase [Bordetella trematum]AUL48035.1 hypothetical protein BTL55_14440 [Bordetella trematum]AZR94955.1 hypothetical protein BBB39_15170 [Bordetella trematum]NNH20070.1 HAMP domain-containing histidine kinase [Bordetella trematum]QIM69980.1 HAMP domain-containing histidine kinase [Bordetella trematum]SAI42402.1 sensor histidine kinase qsec [Bordetella trematum]